MTEKQKMLSGKLYIAEDKELQADMKAGRVITREFNQTTEDQLEYRQELLNRLFEKTGSNIYIEPPFRCDYGSNVTVGDYFFANYDCIMVDVCKVSIGNNVFFGPRVNIFTAGHPIDATIRAEHLEFGSPVTIGDDVWIGGNTVINPGVTIGNDVVIGSGSVVTKDIPDHVVAVGNPCRVLRTITEEDQKYWQEQKDVYMKERNQ